MNNIQYQLKQLLECIKNNFSRVRLYFREIREDICNVKPEKFIQEDKSRSFRYKKYLSAIK